MAFKDFVEKYKVDMKAIERLKKRVFIVGRFNQSGVGQSPPAMYLFTKRTVSETYRKNFSDVSDLSYNSFVQLLKPAVAEKSEAGERFPSIVQVIPRADETLETSFVVDTFNYFFGRAASNSDQPAFKADSPMREDRELLATDAEMRGLGILTQIRRNLQTISTFQHRSFELVEQAARLFQRCAREHGMPAYAYPDPLPGGFPEKLIDFLYSEDPAGEFDVDGLTFSGEWESMQANIGAQAALKAIVGAYRDALLGSRGLGHGSWVFRNQTLDQHAIACVGDAKDLAGDYVRARSAFNEMRQILRSKVLLSMVLEWVVGSLDGIKDAKAVPAKEEGNLNRAIGRAILERAKENGLAEPIKRPSAEERRRFTNELTANFAAVLDSLLGEAVASSLGPELRSLVETMRGNKDVCGALRRMSGHGKDDEQYRAFVDANRTIIMDILCPALFRTPVVTPEILRRELRREMIRSFLAAVLLSDRNDEGVRKIAEDHMLALEERIEKEKIKDIEGISKLLLGDYLRLIANPATEREVEESIRVLVEADALRQAGYVDDQRPSMVMTIHGDPQAKAIRQTGVPAASVSASVEGYVRDKLRRAEETVGRENEEAIATETALETELDRRIDEIMAAGASADDARSPVDARVKEVAETMLGDEDLKLRLTDTLSASERALQYIFRRYAEKKHLKRFAGQVERMMLTNLMLLFQEDLGLGKQSSNLYQLLLDMILHLDPEQPNPMEFLREKSLTEYFNNADLSGAGITDLKQTLKVQALKSLKNIQDFVSELRGISYLMERVGSDQEAEIIVINATADEFVAWLNRDNLTEGQAPGMLGRLRTGRLVNSPGESERVIPPGLVYMTDIAFDGTSKQAWLDRLAGLGLSKGSLKFLLPPICLSTGPQSPGDVVQSFEVEGKSLARVAESVSSPVVILGPSPFLNRPDDQFRTVLPAGYLFAAHMLCEPEQKVLNRMVAAKSDGRFRVIGAGEAFLREGLKGVMWGRESEEDPYSFAADFYLYVVLSIIATAQGTDVPPGPAVTDYDYFYCGEPATEAEWRRAAELLNNAVFGNEARRFSLWDKLSSQGDLHKVAVAKESGSSASTGVISPTMNSTYFTVKHVAWFNAVRRKADLP